MTLTAILQFLPIARFGKFIFIMAILISSTYTWSISSCQTEEICVIGKACECTAAARSAAEVYYYYRIQGLKKGEKYLCNMGAEPPQAAWNPQASTFPAGVPNIYAASSAINFPTPIQVDATTMEKETDSLRIKYWRFPSDISIHISVICELKK
jgi:hypothetical protein